MNTIVSLAWRNLWRHRRRTILTLGAMVFSNVLLVFMITLNLGNYDMMIENSLKAYSGQLQVAATGYNDEPKMRSTLSDISQLAEQIRNVMPESKVTARAITFVLASSEQRSFGLQIAGVDVANEPQVSSIPGLVRKGRYLIAEGHDEIVIGSVLARNLKVGVGDEVTLLGSGLDGSFAAVVAEVCGVFESGVDEVDRSLAQMSLRNFQELFAMQDKGHTIVASGGDIAEVEEYQLRIQGFLSELDSDLEVLNWKELNPGLQQAIQSDLVSNSMIYAVLVILVSLSVLNTQLMSVLERTREFGIMTAIGLRPGELGKLVLLETSIMAGLGLLIGLALGLLMASYFNQVGLSFPGMEGMAEQYNLPDKMYPAVNFVSISSGPIAVFIGCILAAVYPVLRLQKLQPVAAMRAA